MNDKLPELLQSPLSKFEVILLEDMSVGAQMERIDRKFAFHVSRIPEVICEVESNYSIVKAAGKNISLYNSTYLDTEEFLFFQRHHRGALHRDKIRFRTYPNTGTTFLELKRKSNRGRTAKLRIQRESGRIDIDKESKHFIRENAPQINPDTLITSARIDYQRIQFISKTDDERFSIDFDISAHYRGSDFNFGNVAILEVKQDRKFTSSIIAQMRDLRIREASMSKYCLALAALDPSLKSNRFKPDLRRLRKIQNEKY